MSELKWWNDPEVKKMYAVGQNMRGVADDGQVNGWMLEGLFETEQEAVEHCLNDCYFVVPVPIGLMTGTQLPDGIWWPRLQTKEEGQVELELFRAKGHEIEYVKPLNECKENTND